MHPKAVVHLRFNGCNVNNTFLNIMIKRQQKTHFIKNGFYSNKGEVFCSPLILVLIINHQSGSKWVWFARLQKPEPTQVC